MARLARVIVPGLPHHVTQRGNRREPIFFEDGDQEVYRDLLAGQARRRNVEVWAYGGNKRTGAIFPFCSGRVMKPSWPVSSARCRTGWSASRI